MYTYANIHTYILIYIIMIYTYAHRYSNHVIHTRSHCFTFMHLCTAKFVFSTLHAMTCMHLMHRMPLQEVVSLAQPH